MPQSTGTMSASQSQDSFNSFLEKKFDELEIDLIKDINRGR